MAAKDGPGVLDLRSRRVLVAIGGGIAAYKVVEVVRQLLKRGAEVRVMMTRAASRLVSPATFAAITGQRVAVEMWDDPTSPSVDHLQYPHWADVVLVAPATADLIAKMSMGIADDLVSTALVAAYCPVIVAPAMNTHMFASHSVQENLEVLKRRGLRFVGPEAGEMAAPGEDPGLGRMSEPPAIADAVADLLLGDGSGPLAGKRILITAGRTEEPIDDVRFITNRSSGKMGTELAIAASQAGASVVLVHGSMDVPVPERCDAVKVGSAVEMLQAVKTHIGTVDAAIYAAAVADWRPKEPVSGKMKKEGSAPPMLEMVENPDIAAETASKCKGPSIGFALETVVDHDVALDKLKRKGFSAILLNIADAIGADESEITWLEPGKESFSSPRKSKREQARWIISRLAERIVR